MYDFAYFDASAAPTPEQKALLATKLAPRLDAAGRLRVVSAEERSQFRNRELAEQRLVELVTGALRVPKKRRPTKPTKASKERRLEGKRRASARKRDRRQPPDD